MERNDIDTMGRLGLLGGVGLVSGVVAGVLGGMLGSRAKRMQDHEERQIQWRKMHAPPSPKQKRRAKAQAGRKAAHITKRRRG